MQLVRDSDPVVAVMAGAHVRPAEELVTALRKVQQHALQAGYSRMGLDQQLQLQRVLRTCSPYAATGP